MTPSQREGVPTTRGGTRALSIRPLLDLCFEERRMTDAARAELGRPGTLRVGINLGNILLVTGRSASGEPQGVAPDMAADVRERLGGAVSRSEARRVGKEGVGTWRSGWATDTRKK